MNRPRSLEYQNLNTRETNMLRRVLLVGEIPRLGRTQTTHQIMHEEKVLDLRRLQVQAVKHYEDNEGICDFQENSSKSRLLAGFWGLCPSAHTPAEEILALSK